MSSAQPPGDSGEIRRVGGAQKSLDVSFAVFNKRTKQWESPQLDETQQAMVKQALEALRGNAEVTKALNEGATLEITKSGIYLKRGQRWTNLLDDATFSKQRGAVKKTLAAVTGVVGDLSKTAERVEVQPALKAKDGLVIEVTARRREKLADLGEEVKGVLDQVNELQREGKIKEAVEYYATHMPACYQRYCGALVDKRERGEEVDLDHPHELYAYSNELFSLGLKEGSDREALATAMDQIEKAHNAYQEDARHVETCQRHVQALADPENQFALELDDALRAFRDPEFVAWLESEGFTSSEIKAHQIRLEALEKASEAVFEALGEVRELFDAGQTQAGKALYEEKMQQLMPAYHAALEALVIPQRVADNRVPGMRPFALNLDRMQLHQAFVAAVGQEQSVVMSYELKEALHFEPLSDQLNTLIRDATSTIEKRAALMENRELFFTLMRREGYSDLETAALFSFLPEFQEAHEVWRVEMQKAVDLANQKEYAQAETEQNNATQRLHAKLESILARTRPFERRLRDARVRRALTAFATSQGLTHPEAFHELFLLPEQGGPLPNRLTDAQHQFSGFFVRGGIRTHPVWGAEWKKILKKRSLDQKTVLRIDEIYNRLAMLIQPLQEAELAVEMEKDPRVKRELRAQLDRLAQKQQKEIRQLKQELDRLGGRERVAAIQLAVNDLKNIIANQSLSKVPEDPERVELEGMGRDMDAAAKDVISLLGERLQFLDGLYARHHFYIPYRPDPILKSFPRVERDLKALNSWLNAFHREAEPILLAQARLAEDPENALLQEQFNRVFDRHIDQVNKLQEQFEKNFKQLNLEAIETNAPVKFATDLKRVQRKLAEASHLRNQPQSWDNHFLDVLTSTRSPLARMLPGFYARHNMKQKDIKDIQALFKAYNQELRKIHELERQLEAQPGNVRLRSELRRELALHQDKLRKLNEKYAELEPKIQALEQIVREVEAISHNLAVMLPRLHGVIDSMEDQPVDPHYVREVLGQMDPADREKLENEMPTFMLKLNHAAGANYKGNVLDLQAGLQAALKVDRGEGKAECRALIEALGDQPLDREFVKRLLAEMPEAQRTHLEETMFAFMFPLNRATTRPIARSALQKKLRTALANEEKKLELSQNEIRVLVRQCHGFSVQGAFKERRAFMYEVYNRQGLG